MYDEPKPLYAINSKINVSVHGFHYFARNKLKVCEYNKAQIIRIWLRHIYQANWKGNPAFWKIHMPVVYSNLQGFLLSVAP